MATKNKVNNTLFEFENDDWENEWRGMPEFNQPDNGAYRQIIVSFDNEEGVQQFATLINQHITAKTKSLWYPPRDKNLVTDLFYYDERGEQNGQP